MSALDDWIDCDAEHNVRCEVHRPLTLEELERDPIPTREPCNCGMEAQREAARAELAELRRRLEDVELIAKSWALSDEDGCPWGVRRSDGKVILNMCSLTGEDEDDVEIELDRCPRTGLPILNDEAREALKGSK